MTRERDERDIITEEEFNRQTEGELALPENDSPDDSDESLNEEYLLGVNYMPDEKNEIGKDPRETTEKIYADEHSFVSRTPEIELPETAKVISSGGMPLNDLDAPTDTH